MKDFINSQQCREYIADLAELLPELLKKQDQMPLGFVTEWESDESRRGRRDPVFTGGAVVGLLLTDPAAPPPSRTKDIDIVLEITSHIEFGAMEHLLRHAGFTQNWLDNAPVVAWNWRGVRVDFLPHRPTEMMASNRWFPYLIDEAERIEVLPGRHAWCASAPCFMATKLEAFFSRGHGDFLMSKDMEDILAIVDGREEILDEMKYTSPDVRGFVAISFRELLASPRFLECVPQIVPDDARELIVTARLQKLRTIY